MHPPCEVDWHQSSFQPARGPSCLRADYVYFSGLLYAIGGCQWIRQRCRLFRPITDFLTGFLTTPRYFFGRGSFPVSREVLDDLQASTDHMVTHDVVGPFRVRANYGSCDFIMLMKRILCSARNKLKRSKRLEPLSETASDRSDAWIMCTQINSLMKLIIHRRRNPLPRRNFNKTCSTQPPKSFANRGSRYAKLSADTWLVKPRAGFNLTGQDGFYECLKNFV